MNIHEYQAKELLAKFGVPVPAGHAAMSVEEAVAAAEKLPGPLWVVKAQIHAGGRGKGKFTELGPDARVLQARVGWRLAGERADATSTVWLTVVPAPGGVRLAGTDDGAALDAPAEPLWWLAPVTRATRGDVTVLVGPGQDARRFQVLDQRQVPGVGGLEPAAETDARGRYDQVDRPGHDLAGGRH